MKELRMVGKMTGKLALLSMLGLSMLPVSAWAQETTTISVSGTSSAVQISPNAQAAPLSEPIAKITRDEAVAAVKALFPKLKDANPSQVELGDTHTYPPQYQDVWTISWNITDGKQNSYGFESKVDSITGELLQTGIHYPLVEEEEYYPPKVSREEALEAAKAFIRQAAPSIGPDSVSLDGDVKRPDDALFAPVQYYFNFNRLVDGLPSGETISIQVSGNGEVMSYYRMGGFHEYPSSKPAVSKEEAVKKYEASVKLRLQYEAVYKPYSKDRTWFLGWEPEQGSINIDAQTGKLLDDYGKESVDKDITYRDVPRVEPVFAAVEGQGKDKLLTPEQAEELVKQVVSIPAERKLTRRELSSYWQNNRQVWNLSWTETPKPNSFVDYGNQTMAVVDALTGKMYDYQANGFGPRAVLDEDESKSEASEPAISQNEADAKAAAYLNLLYPDAHQEVKLVSGEPLRIEKERIPLFDYNYQRMYEGIPVSGEGASITLDAQGKLLSYHNSSSDDFVQRAAALTATVSQEEATKLYLEGTEPVLQYRTFGGIDWNSAEPGDRILKLVYQMSYKDRNQLGSVIDASTGAWRELYVMSNNVAAQGHEPADVEGHWAQKDLEAVLGHSVLQTDSEGLLHPDESITLGQWLQMTARAVNPNYADMVSYFNDGAQEQPHFEDVGKEQEYYTAAQFYIQSRWLDPSVTPRLEPSELLTRQKLASLIVKLIKYDKLAAQLQTGGQLPYADADQIKERGAVALVTQLGLLGADAEGRLNPQGTVSKAEAATVLMRLVYLQGKLDQRIGQY